MDEEIVLNAQQLECLAAPVTSQAYSCLMAAGRASATEVGQRLSRSPATALYHLRKLELAKLVQVVNTRSTTRRPEALYAPSARWLSLPREDSGLDSLMTRAVLAGARETMRGYASARRREDKHALRCHVRLTPESVRRFTDLLETALEFATANELEEGGVRLEWSSLAYTES